MDTHLGMDSKGQSPVGWVMLRQLMQMKPVEKRPMSMRGVSKHMHLAASTNIGDAWSGAADVGSSRYRLTVGLSLLPVFFVSRMPRLSLFRTHSTAVSQSMMASPVVATTSVV